jgi:asparagine synthase (glutamine-hydrolysing)
MPIDEPLLYGRPDDYIDHFHDLLRKSVGDRLRTNQVWVFMSGGVDSPTLAATARDLMRERSTAFDLRALTNVDSFVPNEAHYAEAAAKYLGIPILYRHWTTEANSRWEQIPFSTPEPIPHGWMIPAENNFWQGIGGQNRIFLYGEGPDNALRCDWMPYLLYLSRKKNYRQLLGTIIPTLLADSRPPFWGRIAKRFERGALFGNKGGLVYPEWLNPSFEARLRLRARWTDVTAPSILHPYRPAAYMSLQIPLWQAMFESFDSGVTKAPFEVRHPFVDIRMLQFLLAVPPLPWCRSKYLLRRSMRGRLPAELLWRQKAVLPGYPMQKFLTTFCPSEFTASPQISSFIDLRRFPAVTLRHDVESHLRVRSLNHWLQHSHQTPHNPGERIACERIAREAAQNA